MLLSREVYWNGVPSMGNCTKCWKVWKSTQKVPILQLLIRLLLRMRPNWQTASSSLPTRIMVTLTSVVVLQFVKRTRMWMRYFSTMPHPSPSSRGTKIVSHYLLLFLCRTDIPNFVPNPTQTPKAMAIFRTSTIKALPWVPRQLWFAQEFQGGRLCAFSRQPELQLA